MRSNCRVLAMFGLVLVMCGCGLELGEADLLPRGTPFVLRGTAAVTENGGPCLVWRGDNGQTYHLFQYPTLENEAFDQITEPGVTSRLVLATRTDLTLDCQTGVIVEVQDVLDIED